jgi:hypothetical protein
MNVIETLYLLLKSDSTQLRKDEEEVRKSNQKTTESFNALTKSVNPVQSAFIGLARQAAGLVTAGLALHTVVKGLAEATAHATDLAYLSDQLGVNVEQLDAWGHAVERTGGTAAGFQQSLRGISNYFNTNPKVALAILPQLADTFQKLSRINAFRLGKVLGLDEPTILLLQKGRREVDAVLKQQKELGLVTKENAKAAEDYAIATQNTRHAFDSLWRTLAFTFLPSLTKVYNAITPIVQYLTSHKDLVVGAFIAMGAAAAFFVAPLIIAAAPVIGLIALITALGAAFALVYEDIKGYFDGINSLTGRIIAKIPAPIKRFFQDDGSADRILEAQRQLNAASGSSINSQTSNSIFSSQSNQRNQSVNTGPITIHTQATDAYGLAAGLGKGIQEHARYSNSYFDDGQAI